MPWSPSSVNDYLACPRKWWLKRHGAQERTALVWSPGMLCGTAFHAGMAAKVCGGSDIETAVYNALEEWPLGVEGMNDAAKRIIKAIGLVELPENERVLGCEVILDDNVEEAKRHGRYAGTADLISEDADGLIVTDYKTHWRKEAQYADAELRETCRAWQFKQYAHFAQQKYQKRVHTLRKILVYFTPALKVWPYECPLSVEQLQHWQMQAVSVWESMDADTMLGGVTVQNANECERYGFQWRCGFYHMCWEGLHSQRYSDASLS